MSHPTMRGEEEKDKERMKLARTSFNLMNKLKNSIKEICMLSKDINNRNSSNSPQEVLPKIKWQVN